MPAEFTFVQALVVADFDNDGVPDVVTNGNGLYFFRGIGSGSFGSPQKIPFSVNPSDDMIAADFNGDGNIDIAVPNWVLLGDGHGGFFAQLTFLGGTGGVKHMAAGDFDGDGILDLATVDFSTTELTILHGMGDGTFVVAATLVIGSGPIGDLVLQSGDLNKDGIDDLIVVNTGDGSAQVMLGQTGGGFVVKPIAPFATSAAGSVVVGDFNNDGIPDVVIAGDPSTFDPYSLFIFPGKGDGTFLAPITTPTNYFFFIMTAGDFDNDGGLDLAVWASTGNGSELSIYPGKGDGSFQPTRITPSPAVFPPRLVAADVHRDGRLDLVLPTNDEYFNVLAGTGDGYFAEPALTDAPINGINAVYMAAGDLNSDGFTDLVVAGLNIGVLLADGSGGFHPAASYPGLPNAAPVIGDFNGDGKPDIAFIDGFDGLYVMLNAGNGSFGAPIKTAKENSQGLVAAGKFDNDQRLGVVLYNFYSQTLLLYKGRGNGSFELPQKIATLPAVDLAVADVDGDGKLDIVVLQSDFVVVLPGHGNGRFGNPIVSPLSNDAQQIAIGDFNEDGKQDVVVSYRYLGGVGLLLGNGAGGFGNEMIFYTPRFARSLFAVDVNGDGHLDIVSASDRVAVLTGSGTGTLNRPVLFGAPGYLEWSVAGDFDHDGKNDVAVLCAPTGFTNSVAILRNSRCEARRIELAVSNPFCQSAGAPFAPQPVLDVVDDGDNIVDCDGGSITASIVPGTGTAGAILTGSLTVDAVNGVGEFSNLAVDRAGIGYKLEFQHPVAASTRTSTFTVGAPPVPPVAGSNSPVCETLALQLQASTVPGAVYRWTGPNGFTSTIQNPVIPNVTPAAAGVYTVTAIVNECESTGATTSVVVRPAPSFAIAALAAACPNVAGYVASVPDAGPSASYAWSISNGSITSGAASSSVTFSTGYIGQTVLSVTVTDANGCPTSHDAVVDVAATCSMTFYTLPPCRIVDTRGPNAPALAYYFYRNFPLTGKCGIPATALAISANVTVTQSTVAGDLKIHAGGTSKPASSVINYGAGQTRANNAILTFGPLGDIDVNCEQTSGTVQFILDVNGYFQ